MSGNRAETAARWLLSLPPEASAAVVERLSRETLEEIRTALARLGEDPVADGPDRDEEAPPIDEGLVDGEPPFLLAALVAATPASGRDALRAAIAARRGPDVLAAIDAHGVVAPSALVIGAIGDERGGRP